MSDDNKQSKTTGHVWDDNIQEFDNPLPTWWVWAFYATIIFALIYWILYPAFPIGKGFTTGIKTQEYTVNGEQQEWHWNTRARLADEMQNSSAAKKQAEYLAVVGQDDYATILADADKMAFARSIGKVLFADNCAACHRVGGAGTLAANANSAAELSQSYPNLADDAWLWGGTVQNIEMTINNGRRGNMPAFGAMFQDEAKLDDLASYVLSLSGTAGVDAEAAARGQASFGLCAGCHMPTGQGNPMMGAANLTDNAWAVVDVNGAASIDDKKALIKGVVKNGIARVMPAWKDRLNPTEIKMLTAYVHELGGGK